MSKITLSELTPQQKKALKAELEKEMKSEQQKVAEQRKDYKEKVNKTLPALFKVLQSCSSSLAAAKKKVYDELAGLVDLKSEVYERNQDKQISHSFSTEDGTTIIIGYRMNDGWDDTMQVGVEKITDYMKSLGKDANSKKLVKTIMQLLSKDNKGNLKASRVLQLKKLADEIGDKKFIDAIQIIQDAYRPTRSKQFVSCRYKNTIGESIELPLSITDAEITGALSD